MEYDTLIRIHGNSMHIKRFRGLKRNCWHLAELIQTVRSLNPIVFYLSSQNADNQLVKAWKSRGKAEPTAEMLAFWLHRKVTDLRVLNRLVVESHHLDVTNNEWDAALDVILQRLTAPAVIQG